MKLKNMLILVFVTLTFIPIVIISILLYKSGYDVSKQSYTRNLTESITVQADYISQTIENNMISDYRFVKHNNFSSQGNEVISPEYQEELHVAFQRYLQEAEDKIAVCFLLNQDNTPVYTIGEKSTLDTVFT